MDRKIRVGAVSYLNTLPMVWGVKQHDFSDVMEISFNYPAKVAGALLNDEVDVGLIPVAMIPKLQESYIISDFCIGATGPVASVCIFSEVPLEQITHLYLDYQSRTSVNLARVLLNEYWKLSPELLPAPDDFIESISGTTAAVVIGDRALIQRGKSAYIYDLAEAWIDHTGLPFVFAAWVANKRLPDTFINSFNQVLGEGFHHLDEIIQDAGFSQYDLNKYFTEDISYTLDESKLKAIRLFHQKISLLPPL
ncbi:MAG TPA: hypothetical protein DEU93_07705 [Chitinophagaceae bacterium]|nr:hypothetical protein [Chitinophagaceae bacterium]